MFIINLFAILREANSDKSKKHLYVSKRGSGFPPVVIWPHNNIANSKVDTLNISDLSFSILYTCGLYDYTVLVATDVKLIRLFNITI